MSAPDSSALKSSGAAGPPARILIVRLGALGDIVHALPVAAALRRAFPSARIDWLVSAKHRELLDLVPIIDRRLVINDRADASGGSSVMQAIGDLRRQHYDVAIDLQGLIKSAMLARLSGASRVIGFSSSYVRERLARLFYTDVHDPGTTGVRTSAGSGRHIVHINLGLLEAVGISNASVEFAIEDVDSSAARAVQDATGGRYVLLNPGAAWPNKRWPPDRFGAIARRLRDKGLPSAVLWGPQEEPLAREVVAHSEGSAMLAPRTTIADLVALSRGASLMVSGDTGPTHIAAAVGTPLVALFGPTRPQRNGPWLPDDVCVSRADVCQCHHLRQCRLATMCLMDVQVEEVAGAIERRLAAGSARGR